MTSLPCQVIKTFFLKNNPQLYSNILKLLFINVLCVQCTVDLKILSLAIVRAGLLRNEATPLGSTFCIDFIYFFMEKTKHK